MFAVSYKPRIFQNWINERAGVQVQCVNSGFLEYLVSKCGTFFKLNTFSQVQAYFFESSIGERISRKVPNLKTGGIQQR